MIIKLLIIRRQRCHTATVSAFRQNSLSTWMLPRTALSQMLQFLWKSLVFSLLHFLQYQSQNPPESNWHNQLRYGSRSVNILVRDDICLTDRFNLVKLNAVRGRVQLFAVLDSAEWTLLTFMCYICHILSKNFVQSGPSIQRVTENYKYLTRIWRTLPIQFCLWITNGMETWWMCME